MKLFAILLSLLFVSLSSAYAQSSGGGSGGGAASGSGGTAGSTLSNGSTISGTGGSPIQRFEPRHDGE
jgi:hypothetical protein